MIILLSLPRWVQPDAGDMTLVETDIRQSQLLQITYTALVSVATYYGLGQLYAAVGDADTYFQAVKWELFSQVAGLMVIGVGKLAVGGFLLRIVRNRYHIIAIWVCLFITTVLTLFASIVVVIQCLPVEKSWNKSVEGYCWINFSDVGYTVGCESHSLLFFN